MDCACQKIPDFPCIIASLQVQTLVADFGNYLPLGVTLTGTPTVTIAVAADSGTPDPSAATRAAGPPYVVTPTQGTAVPNTGIALQVRQMVAGVKYLLTWSCARSDGDTLAAFNHITAVAPV